MNPYIIVKWILPKSQVTKQITTFKQFEAVTQQLIEKYQKKIIPFIRQEQRYYHLKKYQYRIIQKFSQTDRMIGQNNRIRKQSLTKLPADIIIELKYKPEFQIQQKTLQIKQKLNKTIRQLQDKLTKCNDTSNSYEINLKIQKQISKRQTNQIMKHMKIYYLISEPLVKQAQTKDSLNMNSRKNSYSSVLRSQIKLNEHKQIIHRAYQSKNWSINLSQQSIYISWHRLCKLVQKHQQYNISKQIDLVVLQIYTQIFQQKSQLYVSLESDDHIGLQTKFVTLSKLIQKLNQIPNLHLIIIVGPNIRKIQNHTKNKKKQKETLAVQQRQIPSLKKNSSNIYNRSNLKNQNKEWYQQTESPIIAIGVFDPQKDMFFKKTFLYQFYFALFRRRTIQQCFTETKNKMKAAIQTHYIPQCCCMHNQKQDHSYWNKIIQLIGRSTAHKIFRHGVQKQYKNQIDKLAASKQSITKELISYILHIDFPEKVKTFLFTCAKDVNHNEYRTSMGDFKLYNKKCKTTELLPIDLQKVLWQPGLLVSQKIFYKKSPRYRSYVLFQILRQISTTQRLKIILIKGGSNSGKSYFIEQIESYLVARSDPNFKFLQFKSWLKQYRSSQSIQKISRQVKTLRKITEDQKINKKPMLILNLGKIVFQLKQQFQKFLLQIIQSPEIINEHLIILSALSQMQTLKSKQIKQYLVQYSIPQVSQSELKYLVLKDQAIQLKTQNQVEILKEIMKSLKDHGQKQIKSDVYFSYFCKDIMAMIKQIARQNKKGIQRQNLITEQVLKYRNKVQNTLNYIQNQNKQLWKIIGLICSFSQGFLLYEFNQTFIFGLKKDIYHQIKKNEFSVLFYRIFEHSMNNNNNHPKCKCIQPQKNSLQYFANRKQQFFIQKIEYFFNFYYRLYHLMKINTNDKPSQNLKRIMNKLGIFMYDFQQKIQQIIKNGSYRQQILNINQLKQMNIQQRNYVYSYILQHHAFMYLEFLKQINVRYKNYNYIISQETHNHKQLQEISYLMLFAAMCHKDLTKILGEKKKQLNYQTKVFLSINKQIKSQKIIILFAQISSLVSQIFQRQEPKEEQQHKTNLSSHSQKKIQNLRKILQNLQFYELTRLQIERYLALAEQSSIKGKQNQIIDIFYKMLPITQTAIKKLMQNINQINQNQQKQKHYQCILNIIKIKILVRFKYFIQMHPPQLEPKDLSDQLDKFYGELISTSKNQQLEWFNKSEVMLCKAYLKIINEFHNCRDSDMSDIQQNNISRQFLQLYLYVKQKLNPKVLFKSSNIALFMKAGCLKVNQSEYNFVRMKNIISSFLNKQLASRGINLLFLNLSENNLRMLSQQQPNVNYLVISVDCKKNLQVLIEDNSFIETKSIDFQKFYAWIGKIKFKFLILFGSQSQKLSKKLQAKYNSNAVTIISLSLNKEGFDLSTYPQYNTKQQNQNQPNPINIINKFIKVQNSSRIMEMIICSLISLLVKEKQNKQRIVTQAAVQQIVKKSIKFATQVLEKWYFNQKCGEIQTYQISSNVFTNKNHIMQFPQIPEGTCRNLTSKIIATPKNFGDDTYYENIGRISIIKPIMEMLIKNNKSVIEIAGGRKSGKTQILKQIGWFCQTRRIFQLGTYFYDIRQLVDKKQLKKIFQHFDKQYLNRKYLLILLDNLQPQYISSNIHQFSNFFLEFKNYPMSLVYTVNNEPNQRRQNRYENKLVNQILDENCLPSNAKIQSFDINKLQDIQKLCIALINLRHQGTNSYGEILQKYFPDLCKLQLSRSSSQVRRQNSLSSKKKEKAEARRLFKNEKNQMALRKIKSLQGSEQQLQFSHITRHYSLMSSHKNQQQQQQFPSSLLQDSQSYEPIQQKEQQYQQSQLSSPASVKRNPSFQPSNSSKSKKQKSDLLQILELCDQYKKKAFYENQNSVSPLKAQQIYHQNYLNFDIQKILENLQKLNGINVTVVNNNYFERYEYYQ